MIRNYLVVALRHISRSRMFFAINVLGLSIGLACACTLFLFLRDDLSFDKFHRDAERIYRVATEVQLPDGSVVARMGGSSLPLGILAEDKLPEVESFSRVQPVHHSIKNGHDVNAQRVLEVDPNFFQFFSFELIEGDAASALSEPHHVVIDFNTAKKLFGDDPALGKTVAFVVNDGLVEYEVTGVAANCPSNSSIQFQVLMPLPTGATVKEGWLSGNANVFLKLHETADVLNVETKLQVEVDEAMKETLEPIRAMGYKEQFFSRFQSLGDIHLSTTFVADGGGVDHAGSAKINSTLSLITFFVVLIACINFVNLTMSRSATRAKEVGIRKIVGGQRRNLVVQFLGEAFLACLIAFVLAIGLVVLAQPMVNELSGKQLSVLYLTDVATIVSFIGLLILISLCAGLYPAIILSSRQPLAVLSNRFKLSGGGLLQKSLVVIQFGFATVMIAGTMVVFQQYEFMISKARGIDISDVMAVMKPNMTSAEADVLRIELGGESFVESIAMSGGMATDIRIGTDSVIHVDMDIVDQQFISLLGIELKSGRNFSDDNPSDRTNAIIVNEAFVKEAGWDDAVGKEVVLFPYTDERRVVVGVIKDYFNHSVVQEVKPQVLAPASHNHAAYAMALVKIKPGAQEESIDRMRVTFQKLFPMTPFNYIFMEDDNAQRYQSEMQLRTMTWFAAIVAIIISCTGLFGLTLATSERRYREISIRKILGATEATIMSLLFRSILGPIFVGVLMALPVAWFFISEWLLHYPIRIDARVTVFGGSLMVVTLLALGTVIYHATRASRINVVEAVRME